MKTMIDERKAKVKADDDIAQLRETGPIQTVQPPIKASKATAVNPSHPSLLMGLGALPSSPKAPDRSKDLASLPCYPPHSPTAMARSNEPERVEETKGHVGPVRGCVECDGESDGEAREGGGGGGGGADKAAACNASIHGEKSGGANFDGKEQPERLRTPLALSRDTSHGGPHQISQHGSIKAAATTSPAEGFVCVYNRRTPLASDPSANRFPVPGTRPSNEMASYSNEIPNHPSSIPNHPHLIQPNPSPIRRLTASVLSSSPLHPSSASSPVPSTSTTTTHISTNTAKTSAAATATATATSAAVAAAATPAFDSRSRFWIFSITTWNSP
mmetsp:Transcript_16469/g.29756  ORF Transcript_16469/g.29756 Transcript_16469/m.29756 type:complete len:330 (-) Transcript_16469:88-1077(-)